MKTSNTNNTNKPTAKSTSKTTMHTPKAGAGRRGRRKKTEDDFDDLNMWDADVQDESLNDTYASSRRNNYNNHEDADSYEGTGFGRSRFGYDSDDDMNDPYETFRRG